MKKIDWDKPLVTYSGETAKRIYRLNADRLYPNVVIVGDDESILTYDDDGCEYTRRPESMLKNLPIKQTRWINIYQNSDMACMSDSKTIADQIAGPDRVACIEIEWEE